MRRKHCEISNPREIDRILSLTNIGRLATNGADGYPYVTPVNFVWHERKIYFHSALAGEKLENLARDPKVCFEADIPLAYLDTGHDPQRRVFQAAPAVSLCDYSRPSPGYSGWTVENGSS